MYIYIGVNALPHITLEKVISTSSASRFDLVESIVHEVIGTRYYRAVVVLIVVVDTRYSLELIG